MRIFQYTPRFQAPRQRGFTIVELLIVIVVIGILAAISIIAFSGVARSAEESKLNADLKSSYTQIDLASVDTGAYPANTNDVRVSDGTLLEYTLGTNTYCITVSSDAAGTSFYYDKTTNVIAEGTCPGHTAGGPFPIVALSAGTNYSCGVAGGQAYCWGAGGNGRLGNGTTTDSSIPVAVSTDGVLAGRTVTAIAAGNFHTCAIADGAAFCWGNGRLGNGTTTDSSIPVAVSTDGVLAGRTVAAIAAGASFSCVIADGAAFCWGMSSSGQLGNGSTLSSSVPAAVFTAGVLAGRTVTSIAAASVHTCAIADGAAFCWGNGAFGRLGNGTTTNSSVPVAVSTAGVLAGRTVAAIAAGDNTCAIADGAAFCWGPGTSGQVGNGTTTNSLIPVAVSTDGVLAGRTVAAIDSGLGHNCAVADGAAFCWGAGGNGRLGNGTTTNSLIPVAVDPFPSL